MIRFGPYSSLDPASQRDLDFAYASCIHLLANSDHDCAVVQAGDDLLVSVIRNKEPVREVAEALTEVQIRWARPKPDRSGSAIIEALVGLVIVGVSALAIRHL